MNIIRSIWLALSLTLSVPLLADNPISDNRKQVLLDLLVQDCGSCHGLRMKGGLGPALLPSALIGKPAEFITATILNGRPGTAMPAWRPLLTPAEAEWMTMVLLEGKLP
ncbi:MAG: cytochrome c [Gammaproteobacteria bacterium]